MLEVLRRPERACQTLEQKVAWLEDRERIRELIMEYGFLSDALRSGDPRCLDELLSLCAEDVERELGGTLSQLARGKAALRDIIQRPTLRWKQEQGDASTEERLDSYRRMKAQESRHLITGEVIRLNDDGTEAWAIAQYSLVKTSIEDGGRQRGTHEGSYVFGFRKIGGSWKLTRLHVITNHAHNPMFQTLLSGARAQS
jgi:hypothetical protein